MVYIEIDAASPVPIYEQIMDRIRSLVRSASLKPGAPLPSVRQLARDLEINPNTVARAYGLLERDGVVVTAGRRGTRIAPAAPVRANQALERRVRQAVDRVLGETAHLGVDPDELLHTLAQRLGKEPPKAGRPEGD